MADYVDFSGVYRGIDSLSRHIDTLNNNISNVSNNVKGINDNINWLAQKVNIMSQQVEENRKNLIALTNAFNQMKNEQKQAEALQRAISELVRVNQELQQKYGTEMLVRNHMLGILQASDLALITKTTISQCTEQLMISAPEYWLAPALVALAAWISDNKSLADRAVKEAIKRNAEKTYLLFALITRRVNAGRIKGGKEGSNICFIWLAKYFSLQNPKKMTRSIVTYIDCYANGIFGVDKDNICEDQINHWLDEIISSNEHFAEDQKRFWLDYFIKCAQNQIPISDDFYALRKICPENQYHNMINYYSCIGASEDPDPHKGIKSYLKKIKDEVVDKEKLINDIDDQLKNLVNNVEEGEKNLRNEKKRFELIKKFKGDELMADAEMEKQAISLKEVPIDFVERLNKTIRDDNASPSAKKTALAMVKPYIEEAFSEFILKCKDSYPTKINLKIVEQGKVKYGESFTWTGDTENCENKAVLVRSLMSLYEKEKKVALDKIDDTQANKDLKTSKTLFYFSIFIVPFFIARNKRNKAKAELEQNEKDRKAINSYYNQQQIISVNLLTKALSAREVSNKQIQAFRNIEQGESIEL